MIFSEKESRVRGLVDFSRAWNESVGITGALVFTEKNFVQSIEGPEPAIDDLLTKLKVDRRHSGMNILEDARGEKRRFGRWSLAYSGPDRFIDEEVLPVIHTLSLRSRHDVGERLRRLLVAMADQDR